MSTFKHEVLERETQVIDLRRQGLTFDQIAEAVGYTTAGGAKHAYDRAMKRIIAPDVEQIRVVEADRLDIAQAAIWGRVVVGDLPAITTLIRIMERRAKLLGLDMPIKIQQEVTVWNGDSDLDRDIQSLIARFGETGSSTETVADGPSASGAVTA